MLRNVPLADKCCLCSGVLFICMNVDYKVLFTPLTDEVIRDGMEFYTTFFHAPPAIKVRVPVLTLATPEPSPPHLRFAGLDARYYGRRGYRAGREARQDG